MTKLVASFLAIALLAVASFAVVSSVQASRVAVVQPATRTTAVVQPVAQTSDVVAVQPVQTSAFNNVANNPISQWIVLSGLFAPFYGGMYGAPGAPAAAGAYPPYGGTPYYNPISQWIVLSGLFAPTAFSSSSLAPTTTLVPATIVDP